MKYFSLIPTMNYQYPNGKVLESKIIFIRPQIGLTGNVNPNTNIFVIQDGKSPDKTSKEFYNNGDYFWSLLLTNNIVDFYKDWPVTYSGWEEELYKVNSEFTIYSKYNMPVKVGDLICKYKTESPNFDVENYGIITAFNALYRSFDFIPIVGELKKSDDIIILRKVGTGNDFIIVKTPVGDSFQTILKVVQKLESAFQFQKRDSYSGYYGAVSPYYSLSDGIVDDGTEDLSHYPNTVLWKYIQDQLEDEYKIVSFKQNEENKWTFRKNLTVVPVTKLNQSIIFSIQSVDKQKVAFE